MLTRTKITKKPLGPRSAYEANSFRVLLTPGAGAFSVACHCWQFPLSPSFFFRSGCWQGSGVGNKKACQGKSHRNCKSPRTPNFNVESALTLASAEIGFYSPWPVYTRGPTASTLKFGVRGEARSTFIATGFFLFPTPVRACIYIYIYIYTYIYT